MSMSMYLQNYVPITFTMILFCTVHYLYYGHLERKASYQRARVVPRWVWRWSSQQEATGSSLVFKLVTKLSPLGDRVWISFSCLELFYSNTIYSLFVCFLDIINIIHNYVWELTIMYYAYNWIPTFRDFLQLLFTLVGCYSVIQFFSCTRKQLFSIRILYLLCNIVLSWR